MMTPPSELSLDCKTHCYSLKSIGEQSDQTPKLEEFLTRLEEERLKIDAFKRELPLCMQLLTNAMETSRQQLKAYVQQKHGGNEGGGPVLEEFIPIIKQQQQQQQTSSKTETTEKASLISMSDKATWMTSAQLWSQASDGSNKHQSPTESDAKLRGGGAFLPFSKERKLDPELGLLAPVDKDKCSNEDGIKCSDNSSSKLLVLGADQSQTTTPTSNSQTHRKARRCWSPDLHRRFVNALHMLGGSQVATPKQIRELMKVDGLTNDEVKSHLQKYRLHTRRPSPSPQVTGNPAAPQLVVLGGIWVPPEYAHQPALYPTSHPSPHYSEFYGVPTHHHQHQLHHVYNKPSSQSHTHSSPDSDMRGGRSESIEDGGKSQSSSWKADSGADDTKQHLHDAHDSHATLTTLNF